MAPVSAGLILLLPVIGMAQDHCPWINKATVEGVLGTAATESVKVDKGPPVTTVCRFQAEGTSSTSDLQIDVVQMIDTATEFPIYKAECGAKASPLRAIGNEAEMCSLKTAGMTYAAKVIGRVRDRAFIVLLKMNAGSGRTMTEDMVQEKVGGVAEQVAGSLF